MMTDKQKSILLDWVGACQSAYHIENTPGHRFGGIPGQLEENRQGVVDWVNELLEDAQKAAAPLIAERDALAQDRDAMKAELADIRASMLAELDRAFGRLHSGALATSRRDALAIKLATSLVVLQPFATFYEFGIGAGIGWPWTDEQKITFTIPAGAFRRAALFVREHSK